MTPHFLHSPLTFDGLVVETTSRCNAACGMCYQGAGAHGSDYIGDHALAVPEIQKVIAEASLIPSLRPRFHISGGETFIKVKDAVNVLKSAQIAGFTDISATTNAYWAADCFKAKAFAAVLRQSGLNRLEISWDIWHEPFISPGAVNNCIRACHAAGIATNLRLLTTADHSAQEALDLLDYGALDLVTVVSSGPVFAVGRGADLPRETLLPLDDSGSCHTALHLTVNARGDVFPCCAGFDQSGAALFGNVRDTPIWQIAEAMNHSLLLRFVVFEGISSLRPILEACGVTDLDPSYTGICHMCWDIFSRPERVALLVRHFDALQSRALASALEAFDARPAADVVPAAVAVR
jgi:hypothetical protein